MAINPETFKQMLREGGATQSEIDDLLGVKKNKYNAARTEYNGRTYDSKGEAGYARYLDLEKQSGWVLWWIPQVTVPLGLDESLRVDFLVGEAPYDKPFHEPVTRVHAVDWKGKETRDWNRKKKLWAKYGPFPLRVASRTGVVIIEPGG